MAPNREHSRREGKPLHQSQDGPLDPMLLAPRGWRLANPGLEFARRHPEMGATLAVRLAEIEGILWRCVR